MGVSERAECQNMCVVLGVYINQRRAHYRPVHKVFARFIRPAGCARGKDSYERPSNEKSGHVQYSARQHSVSSRQFNGFGPLEASPTYLASPCVLKFCPPAPVNLEDMDDSADASKEPVPLEICIICLVNGSNLELECYCVSQRCDEYVTVWWPRGASCSFSTARGWVASKRFATSNLHFVSLLHRAAIPIR